MPPRAWAGPLATWGAWQKGPLLWRPRRARLLERWLPQRELAQRRLWDSQAAQPTAWPAARLGAGEHALPASAGQREDVRSANNMNDATQPQHFTLRTGTSGSPASSRASSQSGFLPRDSASVPAELPGKLPQLGAVAPEPPASGLRPAGQNVRVLASQVVLDSALVESFNRVLLSGRSLVSTVPPGVAEHNVTVARAFTKLMGAFVTFWDNDAGSKIHLLANPGQDVAPIGAARQEDSFLESQMQLGSLQYPHNPMKGASEHFHFLSVLAGTYDCATSTSTALATCATVSSQASRRSECPRCR